MEDEGRTRRGTSVQGAALEEVHSLHVRHLSPRENHSGGEESTDDSKHPDMRLHSLGMLVHPWPTVDDFEDERVGCYSPYPGQNQGSLESIAGLAKRVLSGERWTTARSDFFSIGLAHSWCDRERCEVVRAWYDCLRILSGRSCLSGPVPGHLGSSNADGKETDCSDDPLFITRGNLPREEI